jgi:hypothetical protein
MPGKATTKKATETAKKVSKKTSGKWSQEVNENSDALDLEANIFKSKSAKKIAASLKESADNSDRKKTGPFRSAMSMLNFYENRAGKNLPAAQKKVLENAKNELRKLFGKPEQ